MASTSGAGRLPLSVGSARPGRDRLLLGLSGGIDSAFLAWRLLEMGFRVHLWHMEYRTRQMRYPKELLAVERIMEWLDARGITGYEFNDHQPLFDRGFPRGFRSADNEILFPQIGWLLRDPAMADINHVVLGYHAQSHDPRSRFFPRYQRTAHEASRRPQKWEWITPAGGLLKADYIAEMLTEAPGLLEACWWCRKPDGDEPCHECSTCKRVDDALDGLTKPGGPDGTVRHSS